MSKKLLLELFAWHPLGSASSVRLLSTRRNFFRYSIVFAFSSILLGVLLSKKDSVMAQDINSVDLELVLAVDTSSSIDAVEYVLQTNGYVKAFQDNEVIAAIEALAPRGIAVTYVEWNASRMQVQSVDWTPVFDRASSKLFAQAIQQNAINETSSGTAIGEALLFSASLFDNNGFSGDRRVIDISADDRYNAGSAPSYARDYVVKKGITVNGIVVGQGRRLANYFRDNVIGGAASFVISAGSYQDYAESIKLKLLRELRSHGNFAEAKISD
jgi:hypothetical protein